MLRENYVNTRNFYRKWPSRNLSIYYNTPCTSAFKIPNNLLEFSRAIGKNGLPTSKKKQHILKPKQNTKAEHKEVLKTVLQQVRDHEVTFNREKCQFARRQIEFFGHVFTKEGFKLSPDKLRAIKECRQPEDKETVCNFLGMVGYLDNYISNYAAIAAPLYQLTREETKFIWVKEEEKVFRKTQDSISDDKTMASFNPPRTTIWRTEACLDQGLSTALLQKTDKGIQLVRFISRTETEKRYSQTEKDALAIK